MGAVLKYPASLLNSLFDIILTLEQTSPYLPYVYAILGNISLVFMQVNMRIVSRHFPPSYNLFLRGLCLLIINSLVVRSSGVDVHQKDPHVFSILFRRSIYASISLACFLGSVPYAPISVVNSLLNIAPILIFFI